MSPAQARQVMIGYLLAPDSVLPSTPIAYINQQGHTVYEYHADKGGRYSIDAISGEKAIIFGDISGRSTTPVNFVPVQQLQQTAMNYVASHYPGYQQNSLTMHGGAVNVQDDANEYYVDFVATVSSGAFLPNHCLVIVEEDSGKLKSYDEHSIPITISTNPAISQAQAVQIGQNWIQQNISTDTAAGEFETDIGPQAPVRLEVVVDASLQEILQYNICFHAIVLNIDAQNGSVIYSDGYASIPEKRRACPSRSPVLRERFWPVHLDATVSSLSRAAITTNGQTYLWAGQLKLMGIQTKMRSGDMVLSHAKSHVSLKVRKTGPSKEDQVWLRNGSAYIPLSAIQRLTNRVTASPATETVLINVGQ